MVNMPKNGPIWPSMAQYGLMAKYIQTNMDMYGPLWQEWSRMAGMAKYVQVRPSVHIYKYGQIWSSMTEYVKF